MRIGTRRGAPRPLALLVVCLLLVAPLLGAGVPAPRAAAQETAAFRFAFWGDPAERDAYQAVVDEFAAANPGIDVQVDYTPGQGDYLRKIATDFAAGTPPDLFLINYRQFGQYAAAGALEPVGPSLEASAALDPADYAPVALDAFRFGGQQTCMPQNVSSLVVYYNADLFAAAGVPLPRAGWTWDEFVATAQALTRDTDGDGAIDQYGVAVEPSLYRMVSFVWSAGGEVVDDPDNPTRLTLDTPEALDGIAKFVSLGANGYGVVPSEEEAAAEDDGARFMRGGAGMFLQSRREVPTLRQIEGFTWDVAPLPVIREAATVLHSDAFCLASAGSAETKAAVWRFVEYAAGEPGQTILAETGRIVPALTRVAESAAFSTGVAGAGTATATATATAVAVAPLPPASSRVFLDNIAVIRRLPSLSTWPEIEDIVNAEFDRAFYAPIDLPAAVATVTERTRDAFARAAADAR